MKHIPIKHLRSSYTNFTLSTNLKRDLSESDEIIIRLANINDAEGITKVHVQTWQESYKGIICQDFLDAISFEDRLKLRKVLLKSISPETLCFMATFRDEVIGFCDVGPSKNSPRLIKGEIYALYLLEGFKRLGIGSELFKISKQFFTRGKLIPYIAWTLENNYTARKFYENHGGRKLLTKRKKIGDRQHQLVGYIFDNFIHIRKAHMRDLKAMVRLSHKKRKLYEKAQPQFWKYAGPQAEISQFKWFEELLQKDDHIVLVAEQKDNTEIAPDSESNITNCSSRGRKMSDTLYTRKILGFIIGKVLSAPEVYNPGGLALIVDDFCVIDQDLWETIGAKLINEIKIIGETKGANQIIVVSGAHDKSKTNFLKRISLTVVSEWFRGAIG